MEKNKKTNLINKLLCITVLTVFFSFIGVLQLAGILEEDRKISDTENRVLASFPAFSVSAVADGSFMTEIEQYLSDQFYGRDSIVESKTFISRILGKTEINEVYLGKDNRLFEVPSAENEEKINETVSAVNAFSEICGIENRFFMLVPNATEIYPEYLPDFLTLCSQEEAINKIYSSLNADIEKIDACEALKNAETENLLYFRTDHHWTADAAFCVLPRFFEAAGIIFDEDSYERNILSNTFFGTLSSSSGIYEKADKISCYLPKNSDGSYYLNNFSTLEKSVSVLSPSKLSEKNQYEVFFGGNFSRIDIQTDNLNTRKLLVIKDSYANCFIGLLIPHFEKIVIIDPRYFNDELQFVLDDNGFTDLLFLYNYNTFSEDSVLSDVLS